MFDSIRQAYLKAEKRFFFLDYDGTLVPFANNPELALPDFETRRLLEKLSSVKGNTVVIISGRDRDFLSRIFDGMKLILIAEHGVFLRLPDKLWSNMSPINNRWKPIALAEFSKYVKMFPGAVVEEKESSIAWHFRNCRVFPTDVQLDTLNARLRKIESQFGIEILEGNHVIEIKEKNINKGIAANNLLLEANPDFILALGDDHTDEYLFRALPEVAFTIKVGLGSTNARYRCLGQDNVAELIHFLLR